MITDWQSNTILFADTLPRRFPALFDELVAVLKARNVPYAVIKGTRDVWLRDFAPIQTGPSRFVQFQYRPDYLRDHPDLITMPRIFSRLNFLRNLRRSKLKIDGGNLVSNASTVILTDKVFQENPDQTQKQIEAELRTILGNPWLIFIPQEPDDIIGHSDGMVQFISKDRVVLNDYSTIDRGFDRRLRKLLKKQGLQITTLPYCPEQPQRRGIDSAVGNYVNFVRVGNLLLVPAYGIPQDREAIRRLKRLRPTLTVVPLNCRTIAQDGGALHCTTWNIWLSKTQTRSLLQDQPARIK